jgi:hypothetical protein
LDLTAIFLLLQERRFLKAPQELGQILLKHMVVVAEAVMVLGQPLEEVVEAVVVRLAQLPHRLAQEIHQTHLQVKVITAGQHLDRPRSMGRVVVVVLLLQEALVLHHPVVVVEQGQPHQ